VACFTTPPHVEIIAHASLATVVRQKEKLELTASSSLKL